MRRTGDDGGWLRADRPAADRLAAALSVPILLLVALLLVPPGASAKPLERGDLHGLRRTALDLLNAERRQHGLKLFGPDAALDAAAQSHADDMARRDYYSHESPEGGTVMDRFVKAGGSRWQLVEENIAHCPGCGDRPNAGDVRRLHEGWMNSPHHRDNILNPGVEKFGFGIAVSNGGLYAVQTFAGAGASRGGEAAGTGPTLSSAQQERQAVEMVNGWRQTTGARPLSASDPLAKLARSLLPDRNDERFALDQRDDLFAALPPDERMRWRQIMVVAAACGGCGMHPTESDIVFFRDQWAGDPKHRRMLSDAQTTHFGFAMRADGHGRKTAVAVLGTAR